MKAIILAAGKGVRMGKYTEDLPKGMLNLSGKTLLERQIESLRKGGVDDIVICTGYQKETILYTDVRYYHNPDFASTNMVETLMCAREELNEDILIAYADIIYTPKLVRQMLHNTSSVSVAVDAAWRNYWELRYGNTNEDLESLTVDDGHIVELGREVDSPESIDLRYIGLIQFSKGIWPTLLSLYDTKKAEQADWEQSCKDFRNGYMTDLLNELIKQGVKIKPSISEKQWLEFDTEQDYENVIACIESGRMSEYYDGVI